MVSQNGSSLLAILRRNAQYSRAQQAAVLRISFVLRPLKPILQTPVQLVRVIERKGVSCSQRNTHRLRISNSVHMPLCNSDDGNNPQISPAFCVL